MKRGVRRVVRGVTPQLRVRLSRQRSRVTGKAAAITGPCLIAGSDLAAARAGQIAREGPLSGPSQSSILRSDQPKAFVSNNFTVERQEAPVNGALPRSLRALRPSLKGRCTGQRPHAL